MGERVVDPKFSLVASGGALNLPKQPKTNPKTSQYKDKWTAIKAWKKDQASLQKQVNQPPIGPKYPVKIIKDE